MLQRDRDVLQGEGEEEDMARSSSAPAKRTCAEPSRGEDGGSEGKRTSSASSDDDKQVDTAEKVRGRTDFHGTTASERACQAACFMPFDAQLPIHPAGRMPCTHYLVVRLTRIALIRTLSCPASTVGSRWRR